MRMTLAIRRWRQLLWTNCSISFQWMAKRFSTIPSILLLLLLEAFPLFFLVAQIVSILLWSLIYYTLFISPLLFISDSVARSIELILDPINPTSPKWFFLFYKKNLDASRASPNGHRLEMFSVETRLE